MKNDASTWILIGIVLAMVPVILEFTDPNAGSDFKIRETVDLRLVPAHSTLEDPLRLGQMYYQGAGGHQDYAEALKWWKIAAEQGIADAQYNIGVMYANGDGVWRDYVQAHMWFSLATASGVVGAGRSRVAIAEHMTPDQFNEAQRLAREWMAKHQP
jgi:TPR repeat protein